MFSIQRHKSTVPVVKLFINNKFIGNMFTYNFIILYFLSEANLFHVKYILGLYIRINIKVPKQYLHEPHFDGI